MFYHSSEERENGLFPFSASCFIQALKILIGDTQDYRLNPCIQIPISFGNTLTKKNNVLSWYPMTSQFDT